MSADSLISIIIPCRNEKRFIEQCLLSVVANDYPKNRLQVLVIDGMSDDGTRGILSQFTENYPFIKMLDNPKKIVPFALNIGIGEAYGKDLIESRGSRPAAWTIFADRREPACSPGDLALADLEPEKTYRVAFGYHGIPAYGTEPARMPRLFRFGNRNQIFGKLHGLDFSILPWF